MITSPETLADQILNLAEDVGRAMNGIAKRVLDIEKIKINGKLITQNPTLTYADVGAVPTSRKINGKNLLMDITLSADDVGALPEDTFIPQVTNTYSTTSEYAMSGIAVAKAVKELSESLADIAYSGDYSDLKYGNQKAPPVSYFDNDVQYVKTEELSWNLVKNKPVIRDVVDEGSDELISGKAVATELKEYVKKSELAEEIKLCNPSPDNVFEQAVLGNIIVTD